MIGILSKMQRVPLNFSMLSFHKTRNRANKSGNIDDCVAFKERNAQVKRVLADTARESWEAFCSDLTDQSKLGHVWNMARRMNGNTTQRTITTLDNGHR